ncbi:MAG: Hsp20/alpha crystallin family protein [Gammaproteobacteria bacterium]|nr:Hsp20/alpha crystallin family protein [Gammaproteobacteria bacterium]
MIKQQHIMWIALSVLVLVCSVQAYIIYDKLYKPSDSVVAVSDSDVNNKQTANNQSTNKMQNWSDPFAEMEKMHQQMRDLMNQNFTQNFTQGFTHGFNSSQDNWLDGFFANSQTAKQDISMEQQEQNDKYIITFHVANMEDNQLNVEVNDRQVALNGKISKVTENKNQFGDIVSRSQSQQTVSRVMSLPYGADYTKAEIEYKKDKVVVTIPKV